MATDPMNEAKLSNSANGSDENAKNQKKLTVLEKHGYTLGKTIGVGAYATVKVSTQPRFIINY